MAFFSNGSEGEGFVAANCVHCKQWRDREDAGYPGVGEGCPVWDAHILHCAVAGEIRDLLGLLIQEDDKGGRTCHLFTPLSDASELERAGQLPLVPVVERGEEG